MPIPTRLSRLLNAANWKYAAGELALIVLGILLALAVNNWNMDRQERKAELELLRQMRSSLSFDLATLKRADEGFRHREQAMESLRKHLRQNLPYADSLDAHFGAIFRFWETNLNRGPYEVLKAKGLDLISSDSVRLRIIHVYDQAYAHLQRSEGDDRSAVLEVLRPYFLRSFRDIRFGENAKPIDYRAVARDPYFSNLIDYRLASLRINAIAPCEAAISGVSGLVEVLDKEIGSRSPE